jgi:predicted TPR repeat methyltransferase
MLDFLKEPDEPPEHLFSLVDEGMHGLIGFASLHAACSLNLFDFLEKGQRTLQELSLATGIADKRLLPLLEILLHSRIITNNRERFENSLLASTYLVSWSPFCQKSHIHKNAVFLEKIWACLPERLIGGPFIFHRGEFFADLALPAMAENALTGRLQRTVREVAGMPEFSTARKMLDLGGGHGLYAIALAALNPGLDAYIFDLPDVVVLAGRYISHHQAARVYTIPGNFFTDAIGGGYDLILSSSNPSGKSPGLLQKIADALNNGGLFVNVQSDDTDRDDIFHALEWQLWTLETEEKGGDRYTREKPYMTVEYRAALAGAGFRIVHEKFITDDFHQGSAVHMVIAKKDR